MSRDIQVLDASFRDPNGHLFREDGILYRQVNLSYREHYDLLMQSGLYQKLVEKKALVAHTEVDPGSGEASNVYKVLKPEHLPFISYPYEWSFSMLKDAALLTMAIHRKAMEFGMSLKDASAYNIQFLDGRPILIDSLSFEKYQEGEPWIAYRQFCQHFLAPLALMSMVDVRLNQLLRVYIDGIPLDLASRLLPLRSRLGLGLGTHIHLHARAQKQYADVTVKQDQLQRNRKVSKLAFLGLVENLESTIRDLKWKPVGTEWAEYYDQTNYNDKSMQEKQRLVAELLEQVQPQTVWDLGANTGSFSRIAAGQGVLAVAFDIDSAAVEQNYLLIRKNREKHHLPLVLDLTNPSPAIGWDNHERDALPERGPADCVMALALIHHLAISNNVPLPRLAKYFARLGKWLIIEFVPKEDSQVQRLLQTRLDIFPQYQREEFEKIFGQYFEIVKACDIQGSKRSLYLMKKRPSA